MATRKVRRGRKTRGRKRGGDGESAAVPLQDTKEDAKAAANAAAANAAAKAAAANAAAATSSTTPEEPIEGKKGERNEGKANANPAIVEVGGKRGTRKRRISRGASKWNQFVMRTFKEMRKKNKDVKLMDAMKECSKQKKKGIKY